MTMLKKNKIKIVLSSVIVLLPVWFGIIRWNDLPDVMTTHWGADGNADGVGGKVFAVFGLPFLLLVTHLLCVLFTLCDKKQEKQSPKALGIIFWIVPGISLFSNGIVYRAAFGGDFDLTWFVPALLGVMFLFIGNYLPKIKQNRTLGIKISWTLHNEENWNKTHRLGGKVWVAGGWLLLVSCFLPLTAMVRMMVCVIAAMVLIPILYSWHICRQHRREGVVYAIPPKSKAEKIAAKLSAVIVFVFLIGAAVLLFSGGIEIRYGDTSFTIDASYWTDLEVDYSEVDSVEYRGDLDVGMRTNGFGSAKLSLGIFRNDEFGSYTLYADTGAEEYVVLTSGTKTLVIGMRDAGDTRAIYDTLLEKTGR